MTATTLYKPEDEGWQDHVIGWQTQDLEPVADGGQASGLSGLSQHCLCFRATLTDPFEVQRMGPAPPKQQARKRKLSP